ncbi:hypothetical protein [Helicobacter sp. 23-1045]
MLILCANLVCALIVAVLDVRFLISFEVAWVGAMMIVRSSYRSVMRKVSECNSSLGIGNSSLTRPSREFEKFSLDEPSVLSRSNFSAQPTNLAQDTRIAEDLKDSKNPSLRGKSQIRAKQSKKKSNPCEAPESRPLRGAKNRIQGCSSATADFLLEADKRGTPPKSEKAAAFWEHNLNEVGGSGSGVQPFLRKESSESKWQNGENLADSASLRHCEARSAEAIQKNNNMDCHDSATQNLAMTKKSQKIAESDAQIAESTPESLPKKERFFIGAKISFGLFRLLSYAFLGISVIALINNGAFFAIPFLLGIALSTLTSAIYAVRKLHKETH